MHAGNVLARLMVLHNQVDDLVQVHRRSIDQRRALGAVGQHALGHQTACIKAHLALGDQITPAKG